MFWRYCKERRRTLLFFAAACAVYVLCFWLCHLQMEAVLYPTVLCAALGLIFLLYDYLRVKRAHEMILKKQIPQHAMEEDYRRMIACLQEEAIAAQQAGERRCAEMVDYYTVWAHQIKTPIAAMRLKLQDEDSALSRSLRVELHRIEQYAQMVLTFVRLDSDATDYVFRECDIDGVIRRAVKRFSSEFILRKLTLRYEPLALRVLTDEKWLEFVIEQVISNALKYTSVGGIEIFAEGEMLCIRDTGMGIAAEDLPRIFENGFTGCNGRADHRASGIGLYLCKRICTNLGHDIAVESGVDRGTTVRINLARERLKVE